jgi:hypothetical protein
MLCPAEGIDPSSGWLPIGPAKPFVLEPHQSLSCSNLTNR